MKTIAKELAEKAMAGKDFDRDFYIEYLRKLYEVMDSKACENLYVQHKKLPGEVINYCRMLTFEDESLLLCYFVEEEIPIAFKSFTKD